MQTTIKYAPSYSLAVVRLDADERLRAETGAMVSMDSHIAVETSTGGGIRKGLKRMFLGGESFFINTFRSVGKPGEITLAPTQVGDILAVPMMGQTLFVQSGSYLASLEPGIDVDTKFQGFRSGFFSGEGLFMLKVSGTGTLLLSSYGAIREVNVNGKFTVDTGHIVAFEDSLTYKVRRVGNWTSTFLSGEGLTCEFNGRGKLWIQTRNLSGLINWLRRTLPPRRARS